MLGEECGYARKGELGRLLFRRFGFRSPKRNYQTRQIMALDNVATRAYLAGLFDGEGSIMRRKNGGWTVSIGNTHKGVIDWLMTLGGGTYASRPGDAVRKPSWHWRVNRIHDVLAVLEAMLPYLIIKRQPVEAALEAIRALPLERIRRAPMVAYV